jgi:iron complex outermembrane recepter protein
MLSEWQVSEAVTINGIASWRKFDSTEIFDPDGFSLPMLVFAENAEGEQSYTELRVRYDAGGLFSGFAGASYFTEDGFQRVPLQFDERVFQALLGGFLTRPIPQTLAGLPQVNLNPALAGRVLKQNHIEEFTNYGNNKSYDLFADATLHITPKIELTAGVRYTNDDKTTSSLLLAKNGPSNLTGTTILVSRIALNPGGAFASRSASFDRVTYRAVARWAPIENVSLYASLARGARPDVIAVSTANVFTDLPSETVDSVEIGAKASLFDGSLVLDGSVYDYSYENFQTSIINAQGVVQSINAGNASSQGAELLVNWAPTDWFQGYFTYGYNKSRFDDTDSSGQRQAFAGRRFRLSPDNKVAISGTFSHDFAVGTLAFTPIYTWQSETVFEINNLVGLNQTSFGLLDARLAFTPANSRFKMELFGRNLADEKYIIDAGNTGGAFGIPTFIAGPPLTYGVRVGATF